MTLYHCRPINPLTRSQKIHRLVKKAVDSGLSNLHACVGQLVRRAISSHWEGGRSGDRLQLVDVDRVTTTGVHNATTAFEDDQVSDRHTTALRQSAAEFRLLLF
eukprot:COSAG01_NODE_36134_length_521_cov_6.694313_2_plen_104_part_00